MPVKYWEQDKYSYLISIINNKGIRAVLSTKTAVKKPANPKIDSKKQSPVKNIKIKAINKDKDNKLSVNEVKSLYREALKRGDIENAQKLFEIIKEK